jgi:aryl-alcohol dehydrogenase-like predicted oxidoreductase
MHTTTLGMTGLKVSRIAFGTWQLGGDWGSFDESEAVAAITSARDHGVNLFDTAQAYGFGASERLLGRALRFDLDHRREEILIATKGGLQMRDNRLVRDSTPDSLRHSVEDSLRALGVDHIDLYQIHWPDPDTPPRETAGALQEMVEEGKIRHVGVSNFDVDQISAFAQTRPVETVQPPYHLFRRDIEADLLPYAAANDIGVLVYGPLAHGLLTGTIDERTSFAADDWRSKSSLFRGEALRQNMRVVRGLQEYAAQLGVTVSRLAIAWVLAQSSVQVAIVGSRSPGHLADSLGAADVRLTDGDLARIDQIMADAVPVSGPSPESV